MLSQLCGREGELLGAESPFIFAVLQVSQGLDESMNASAVALLMAERFELKTASTPVVETQPLKAIPPCLSIPWCR